MINKLISLLINIFVGGNIYNKQKAELPSPKFIPRLTFWANKKITAPEKIRFRKYGKKVSFTATKKECRHKWIIGAGIGGIEKGKIKSIGLYIRCEKCNKIIKAYRKN